jgi:hypothetical protein
MHVCVKETIANGMAQETLDDVVAQGLRSKFLPRGDIGNWNALNPFGCQNLSRSQRPVNAGQAEVRHRVAWPFPKCRRLHAQIKFELHRMVEISTAATGRKRALA